MNLAATIANMKAAGMTPEAIVTALECLVIGDTGPSNDEMMLARKRENDRIRMQERRATVALQSRDTDDKKEIPHTPLEKTTTIENNSAGAKPSKGSRLPGDFEPTPDLLQSVSKLGFSETELLDQLERFRDWANAATGQVAIKRDWQAAFRNWLKRAADNRKPNHGPDRKQTNTLAAGFAVVDAAVDELLRREASERGRSYEDHPQEIPRLRQVSG